MIKKRNTTQYTRDNMEEHFLVIIGNMVGVVFRKVHLDSLPLRAELTSTDEPRHDVHGDRTYR